MVSRTPRCHYTSERIENYLNAWELCRIKGLRKNEQNMVLARKPEPEVKSKKADHDVGAVMDDTQDLDCRKSNYCTLRKERHIRNNAFHLLFPSGDYFSSLLWSRSW